MKKTFPNMQHDIQNLVKNQTRIFIESNSDIIFNTSNKIIRSVKDSVVNKEITIGGCRRPTFSRVPFLS